MNTEIFKKLFPREYILRHLENNERVDGRAFDDFRKITIEKSNSQ